MTKPFKVKDPKTGLWVAPNSTDLPGMEWTEDEKQAQAYEGSFWRDFWQKMGYEVVEVK
jgi:hypothetical protein